MIRTFEAISNGPEFHGSHGAFQQPGITSTHGTQKRPVAVRGQSRINEIHILRRTGGSPPLFSSNRSLIQVSSSRSDFTNKVKVSSSSHPPHLRFKRPHTSFCSCPLFKPSPPPESLHLVAPTHTCPSDHLSHPPNLREHQFLLVLHLRCLILPPSLYHCPCSGPCHLLGRLTPIQSPAT